MGIIRTDAYWYCIGIGMADTEKLSSSIAVLGEISVRQKLNILLLLAEDFLLFCVCSIDKEQEPNIGIGKKSVSVLA